MQAQARARFDVPGLAIAVKHAPHFVELIVQASKIAERSEPVVLLGSDIPCAIEVIDNPRLRD